MALSLMILQGCNSISAAEFHLRKELQKIDLPIVSTNFRNIGENLEQLRTCISALIETIRK